MPQNRLTSSTMNSKVNLDSPQTPFFKPARGFCKSASFDHLIVGQAIAGRVGILQLPGNWDALIDEPLLAEQTLTIRGFELLLIVE